MLAWSLTISGAPRRQARRSEPVLWRTRARKKQNSTPHQPPLAKPSVNCNRRVFIKLSDALQRPAGACIALLTRGSAHLFANRFVVCIDLPLDNMIVADDSP